ncbi:MULTISPECIES: hypothetical protein [unclassified Synechocystis]|uniref:hypothetical protein n=1 Tax=unclassified Synechocystis TaxID=2640012 RepID=UPI000420461C|nr:MULTISPECIES: hypothetical protein [unclassified Synechocystis]AIE75160.1 hypothetical protein D082_26320 [Synechocystis sp. PCC 6714]MCT0252922.1 hypothetical protein [Synechocystis sp. CS-94]
MNLDLSKLGNIKVESLVQQGLDTILNRQSKSEAKSTEEVSLIKKSLDLKGELYRLPPSHKFTIAAYQVRHQNSVGSILITLDNLREFNKMLDQEILQEASKGHLRKADRYIRQKRNVDTAKYTHRIKSYRVNQAKAKILTWIIDWDFHKQTYEESSYGSGTARSLMQELATSFLDHPAAKNSRRDYLDAIMDLNWVTEILQAAKPFYNHSQITHKIIYHHLAQGQN